MCFGTGIAASLGKATERGHLLSRDVMKASLFWLSTIIASLMLILVVANAFIFVGNQSTQTEVNQRQQFINQTAALSRVYEALVRSLAQATASTNDERLRALLAQNGITVTVTPNPAPAGQGGANPAPATAAPANPAPAAPASPAQPQN